MPPWDERFEPLVGHYSKYQESATADEVPNDKINVIDSDLGRKVHFSRVAVHHVVLPPGCRTSSPHAESLEEEFVLVLRGTPQLWLNGFIYDLQPGHAVGFPAGTGIAHTLLNNTEHDVHLLVAGDKTKNDNLCAFPINPELKESCKIWWADAPTHPLGPHAGLPGPVTAQDKGTGVPECLVHCPSVAKDAGFHYPGDNESFGTGFRLTKKIGLKTLGIWYEYLPPGRRTAFPHAHTHEEEFIFVLRGQPTLWLDGFTQTLEPDWFAAFPPNTGTSHTLINDTQDEVIYLCIGETKEFPDEKIWYPLNPLRNHECNRKGWSWQNAPRGPWGSHSGKPSTPFPEHLSLRLCSTSDRDQVLSIFKKSPEYFEKVDGCRPSAKTVEHALVDGPKKTSANYFKEFLLIESKGEPIGVLDLHAHHPEDGMCYLGLLLIDEALCGQGLGRRCYQLAEDYVKRAWGCTKIRLGISDDNEVSGFWQKMGFEPNGKTYEWKGEAKTTHVREFDKELKVK